ncbi:MAG TPA: tetratricopeptide repeat protein [Chloroflexota bacterium]
MQTPEPNMSSSRFDEVRDYAFADQTLALRQRIGLTQRDLATLLSVSAQSIHAWEAGLSYPGTERLKQMIMIYLDRGAFTAGQEAEEAAALWATVREKASRRTVPFDASWFATLQHADTPSRPPARPPANLPTARTSFIGRVADVTTIMETLEPTTGTSTRLLTLIGVAGCGKTRLALEVADLVRDTYTDGVWLVEVAPLPASSDPDPTPVVAAMLTALGLHEQSGESPLHTLIRHLQSDRSLLILDNCEHVVAACASLTTQLLRSCPELQILATSQCTLGTPHETVLGVTAFALPAAVTGSPTPEMLELLRQSDAVQLFVERAQAVQPRFVLSSETAAGIAAICRQLDALPLAIELAAVRLNVLTVDELLVRLNDRFRLLRRGGHTVVDRHQTLQTTMDWCYSLLDLADQAVLRRLAVFAGGWDLAAAEAVCAGDLVEAEAILEILDELTERSLVYLYAVGDVPRYGMLETVRQYGLQQLELVGETAALRDRHLTWCVTLTERASSALLSREQIAWLTRLDREHDNLRAAMQWALDRGLSALGLRVAAGLWQFWRNRGHLSDGRRWLSAFLSQAPDDENGDATSRAVRADALEGAAWLAEDEHEFAQASTLFAQSSALLRELGRDEHMTDLLINQALEARAGGDYARATALLEESLARHCALGHRDNIMGGGLGLSLIQLALVLRERGEYARATALCEECLSLHRELRDREGVASTLLALGDIARDLGDAAQMHAYCQESLAIFREFGLKWAIGFSLNNLALAAYLEGDLVQAELRVEESEATFRNLQAGPSVAEVLITVGLIKGAQGAVSVARAALSEALELAWAEGPRFLVAAALEEFAMLATQQGDTQPAIYLLSAAAKLRRTLGVPVRPVDQPRIDGALATARMALGPAKFADAWERGQAWPLERIVKQEWAIDVGQNQQDNTYYLLSSRSDESAVGQQS